MSKNKKESYTKEFLMEYGLAILVVFIAIGFLAYFGAFDLDRFLPEENKKEFAIKMDLREEIIDPWWNSSYSSRNWKSNFLSFFIGNKDYEEIKANLKWTLDNTNESIGILFWRVDNITYNKERNCFEIKPYLTEEQMKELIEMVKPRKVMLNTYSAYKGLENDELIKRLGLIPICEVKSE